MHILSCEFTLEYTISVVSNRLVESMTSSRVQGKWRRHVAIELAPDRNAASKLTRTQENIVQVHDIVHQM